MTYKAISLARFAESFRSATEIVELPFTAPGPGEIRVRNLCCGINAIFDTQSAANKVSYINIALPTLTGVEALGVVDAVGEGVTDLKAGDAVATVRFRGGYREANIGPAADFARVPAPTPDYLALASTGVSALLALEHMGEVKAGDTVAISAAAGGLGHLLVQLAKLNGCHVIAVTSGGAKAALVKRLGADRVINYRSEDVDAVLATEYPHGLDVAIDTVSGKVFDAFLANMAVHGRLVVAGAASDMDGAPEIVTGPRITHAIYYKGVSVRGFMNGLLGHLWPEARAKLFAHYAAGRLKIVFDEMTFTGLEGIYGAIDRLLSGQSMGKVVVHLGHGAADGSRQ
jgi:NADPH-dependent curcumin reductase CurA